MSSANWSVDDAKSLYSVPAWSGGFFDIDDQGRLIASIGDAGRIDVALVDVVEAAKDRGLGLPLLVRFSDVLSARVSQLQQAFSREAQEQDFSGGYQVIYPIKVNQRASVVQQIYASSDQVGLEAGSKPELMAVLAVSRPGGTVVCNGYKDEDYIRLALSGIQMGLNVQIVLEKITELSTVLAIAEQMQVRPRLGLRMRLASIGYGKWQNTGGDAAKFGLSPGQIMQVVRQLEQRDMLDCLQLLHFHMGSQISNIRDIQRGVTEACRYFAELSELGANIQIFDVGGGLGVDYEGAGSRNYFSMNYSLEQYAATIIRGLSAICAQHDLPHPQIFSESGRALTAHHAVLITDVIAQEKVNEGIRPHQPHADAPDSIRSLRELLEKVQSLPVVEVFEDAQFHYSDGKDKFVHGVLNLDERAELEEIFYAICRALRDRLVGGRRAHRAVSDEIEKLLSDKYFCNFSVFRSAPDSWAIDQLFPITPLTRLDEQPDRHVVLEDLTCDSDGRIDRFVESDATETRLRVHSLDGSMPYMLGIFMVGAYQEILGDNHNLFGLTHTVDVETDQSGWQLRGVSKGDSASQVLSEVGFGSDWLAQQLVDRMERVAKPTTEDLATFREFVTQNLDAYTYWRTEPLSKAT